MKPLFKTTWEIGTTWELRTATPDPRLIQYIETDIRNKTTSEFRTVSYSPLGVPNSQVPLYLSQTRDTWTITKFPLIIKDNKWHLWCEDIPKRHQMIHCTAKMSKDHFGVFAYAITIPYIWNILNKETLTLCFEQWTVSIYARISTSGYIAEIVNNAC